MALAFGRRLQSLLEPEPHVPAGTSAGGEDDAMAENLVDMLKIALNRTFVGDVAKHLRESGTTIRAALDATIPALSAPADLGVAHLQLDPLIVDPVDVSSLAIDELSVTDLGAAEEPKE